MRAYSRFDDTATIAGPCAGECPWPAGLEAASSRATSSAFQLPHAVYRRHPVDKMNHSAGREIAITNLGKKIVICFS